MDRVDSLAECLVELRNQPSLALTNQQVRIIQLSLLSLFDLSYINICTCFVFSFALYHLLFLLRWAILLLFGRTCWTMTSRGWCLLPDTRASWTPGGSGPPRRGRSSLQGWRVWRGTHSPPLPHLPSGQIVVAWLRQFLSGSVPSIKVPRRRGLAQCPDGTSSWGTTGKSGSAFWPMRLLCSRPPCSWWTWAIPPWFSGTTGG